MIKVKKAKGPLCLTGRNSEGKKERKAAEDFYKKKGNKNVHFDFIVYKNQEVKDLLEKIFKKKCAYCESSYGATSYINVEHYRPKGKINEEDGSSIKPGYYWLAAEWDNLLPSCINCNQRHSRKIWGKTEKELTGKGNLFPLENFKKRAKNSRSIKNEKPLLLHPYFHNPDLHLKFTEDGFVIPVKSKNGKTSKKGEASIEVYGLMREDLVIERQKVMKLVSARILNVLEKEELCQKFPKNLQYQSSLEREVQELFDFLDSDKQYLAMLNQYVANHPILKKKR